MITKINDLAKAVITSIEEVVHSDGSPLGNANIGSGSHKGMGICPDKSCPSYEMYFKCYRPCFSRCKTYLQRDK